MEPEKELPFYKSLEEESGQRFEHVENFEMDALWLSRLTKNFDEWIRQGEKYEEAGKYDQAIQSYKKGRASVSRIKTCEMKKLMEERNYEEALVKAIELDSKDDARRMLGEIEKKTPLDRMVRAWLYPDKVTRKNGFKGDTLTALIKDTVGEDQVSIVEDRLITELDKRVMDLVTSITEECDNG